MKKKAKDVLAIIGAEIGVALLLGCAIFLLAAKLEVGQHFTSNRFNFNVPVAGALVILAILGIVVLVFLPRTMWRDRNMTKAERKKRRRQERKAKPAYRKSDIPWQQ